MMNATKQELIEFISANFVTPEGEHPTKAQLDVFKKDDLAKVVANACVGTQLNEFLKGLHKG